MFQTIKDVEDFVRSMPYHPASIALEQLLEDGKDDITIFNEEYEEQMADYDEYMEELRDSLEEERQANTKGDLYYDIHKDGPDDMENRR